MTFYQNVGGFLSIGSLRGTQPCLNGFVVSFQYKKKLTRMQLIVLRHTGNTIPESAACVIGSGSRGTL